MALLEAGNKISTTSFSIKKESPKISEIIIEGPQFFSASQAGAIVREYRYENQKRDNSPGGLIHIARLTDMMRRDEWRPKDQIDFARMPNGRLILLNGHHRLRAQEESGVKIQWNIVIHKCETEDDVARLYCTFDATHRRRSTNTLLGALDLASDFGVRRETIKSLYSAVPLIACNFDLSKLSQDPLMGVIDRRVAIAEEYRREIVVWEQATLNARGIKKNISKQGPLAVAMVTLRYHPRMARQFWEGIAENDGLVRLDPRHTYLRYLHGDIASHEHVSAPLRYAVAAWNAWHDGEKPKYFVLGTQIEKNLPINIAGI